MSKFVALTVVALFGLIFAVQIEAKIVPSIPKIGSLSGRFDPSIHPLANETFTLSSGWIGKLNATARKLLVPTNHSPKFFAQNVTVYPGYHRNLTDSIYAEINATNYFKAHDGYSEYNFTDFVTIVFNTSTNSTPNVTPPKNPLPYMNGTSVPQYNQTMLQSEPIRLYPGWTQKLNGTQQQLFVPVWKNSTLQSQVVTVQPGWFIIDGLSGIRATMNTLGTYLVNGVPKTSVFNEFVTIWFNGTNNHNNTGNTNASKSFSTTYHYEKGNLLEIELPLNIPYNGSISTLSDQNLGYLETALRFPLSEISKYRNFTLKVEVIPK